MLSNLAQKDQLEELMAHTWFEKASIRQARLYDKDEVEEDTADDERENPVLGFDDLRLGDD